MLKIGSIATVNNGTRFGVVCELFTIGQRKLACVHYIDTDTGKPMVCPDHARCGSTGHTCPIHSANVDTHTLTPWPVKDVEFYRTEGMICAAVARKANAPAIRISRRKSHRYTIETLEEGFVTRKTEVSPTFGRTRDEWQIALALTNPLPFGTSAIVTDPDSDDYKTFAALFNDHPLGGIDLNPLG